MPLIRPWPRKGKLLNSGSKSSCLLYRSAPHVCRAWGANSYPVANYARAYVTTA